MLETRCGHEGVTTARPGARTPKRWSGGPAGLGRAAIAGVVAGGCLLNAPAALALDAAAASPDAAALAAAAAVGPASTAAYGARCIGAGFDDTAAFQAAIDTGRTVYAPAMGGHCHVTRALTMRTPGQLLYGDGRARTRIEVQPGFSGEGVFVAATGEPGPLWRDFSVGFAQPDTDERSKLTRYPPAFLARNTPRFQMEHLGCYVATTCVDMKGNSGGATIADLQMSAFEVGVDIDGSLDTVRIESTHWWPFAMSEKQQRIFSSQGASQNIGLKLGRVDNIIVSNSLFYGGLAIAVLATPQGSVSGSITGSNFDTTSGIEIAAGSLQVSACGFIQGRETAKSIVQTGGYLEISSSVFANYRASSPLVFITAGTLLISASRFDTGPTDIESIFQNGSNSLLLINNNHFSRTPDLTFLHPTIHVNEGRMTAIGNFSSDKGLGQGTFFQIEKDNRFTHVMGNSMPGWTSTFPVTHKGVFLFN